MTDRYGFALPKAGKLGLSLSSSPKTNPSLARGGGRRRRSQCESLLHEREGSINREVFDALLAATGEAGPKLPRRSLLRYLESQGLQDDDERIRRVVERLRESDEDLECRDVNILGTKDALVNNLIMKAIHGRLIIPDFEAFASTIKRLYDEAILNTSGKNADYIPQLARVDPEQFGVAVCTTDGQRFAVGDANVPFCIQSCSKVVTYAVAQSLHGAERVHEHVGVEPSGQAFNQMVLDERAKLADVRAKRRLVQEGRSDAAKSMAVRPAIPHNPCINAGAIMCASLVLPDASADERFDYVLETWKKLCGCHPHSKTLRAPTFAASTYLSERGTADRNFCLAYMMKEEGTFLEGTDILAALDLYFMYCSIECTVHTLSVVAGTLANGGTCPVTGVRVFDHRVVRNCLSVMQSAGMYDYSGTFSFRMGFPAKSGVGGALLIVIPGVCGFATWSPRLDEIGNSARGVTFCKLLSEHFSFHMFAPHSSPSEEAAVREDEEDDAVNDFLARITPTAKKRRQQSKGEAKVHPRRAVNVKEACTEEEETIDLLWAAKDGDVRAACQIVCRGGQVNGYDYDLRTPLHVAACEGHADLVKFLLKLGADPFSIDRFGGTPLSDAKSHGFNDIAVMLETHMGSTQEQDSNSSQDAPYYGVSLKAKVIFHALKALLKATSSGELTAQSLICELESSGGIHRDDDRLKGLLQALPPSPELLTPLHIEKAIAHSIVRKAIQGRLVIPDWGAFLKECSKCFEAAQPVTEGNVASYIPILSKADPEKFGVAICSIDGQRLSLGDYSDEFGVQSSMKPLNYAIALETTSFRKVYQHIGVEPSGRPYNEMILDRRRVDGDFEGHSYPLRIDSSTNDDDDFNATCDDYGCIITPTAIPHNAMINSGAIMCSSVIKAGKDVSSKLKAVERYWTRLTGGRKGFNVNEEMYISETQTADRNRCLAYMMKEAGAFPEEADLETELEFYFRCCSQMQSAESMAIVAGTLANGGCCPLTNDRIFSPLTVQAVLSVMFTCGMYDYSGQFAFSMGFPAKSGVAGSILMVVPGIMGICTWSPPLDGNGNSCRGIAFAKCLADIYDLHIFDTATETLKDSSKTKQDLRFRPKEEIRDLWTELGLAVVAGDRQLVEAFAQRYGKELLNSCDYDGRTALHLACAKGQSHIVRLLVNQPGIDLMPSDRWGTKPVEDARKCASLEVIQTMENALR